MPHIEQQTTDKDTAFLKRALELAEIGIVRADGGPFGALIVKNDQIISEGWNTVIADNDPTAHAEMNAIRLACEKLKHFHLTGCTIYASSEPCPMCLSAAYWARADRIIFANPRFKAASIGFSDEELYLELALPIPQRKIHMRQIAVDSANDVMEKWTRSKGKVEY
ncbi:MAG: nucleoside deaminase [Holophagales bacterium]|jgi:tRNA(Arg) A34 adenosine deaminase TadA|nr:nucleoside deaminase [Holophagales bacterium]